MKSNPSWGAGGPSQLKKETLAITVSCPIVTACTEVIEFMHNVFLPEGLQRAS